VRLSLLAIAASASVVLGSVVALALELDGGGPRQVDRRGERVGPRGGERPILSAAARRQIPAERLRLYRAAGQRVDIDWTFLAAIGAQECDHGACPGDNGEGCAGPMQIAVRRGSPCSPDPTVPTEWERWGVDADADGVEDVDDPADAIFSAALILRFDKGAPGADGPYRGYRAAACRYYGACADVDADYAAEVMARAVRYGFLAERCGELDGARVCAR
jgi:hypothetical protein